MSLLAFAAVLCGYIIFALILALFVGAAFRMGGWSSDLLLLGDDDWDDQ